MLVHLLPLLVLLALAAQGRASYEKVVVNTAGAFLGGTCFGVYHKTSTTSGDYPSARVLFPPDCFGNFSYVVYNYEDVDSIGLHRADDTTRYICQEDILANCGGAAPQEFIVGAAPEYGVYRSQLAHANGTLVQMPQYYINATSPDTGYYCVLIYWKASDKNLNLNPEIDIEIENPSGLLPAENYSRLIFYGATSIMYTLIGMAWLVLIIRHWRDILDVQIQISGVIFMLMLEFSLTYGFYEDWNKRGDPSYILMTLMVILQAGRMAACCVILLLLCLGYGVVKPTLGTTMNQVLILGFVQFFFNTLLEASKTLGKSFPTHKYYVSGTLSDPTTVATSSSSTSTGIQGLFAVPVAITISIFYFWIMNGLQETTRKLELRRQTTKLKMYRRLQWLLLSTLPVIVTVVILNIINVRNRNDLKWVSRNWNFGWFYTDGLPHFIFFYVFIVIIFLWRPTTDNARYGLEELPSDDVDDDDEDEERIVDSEAVGNIKLRSIHRPEKHGARGREQREPELSPALDGPHDIGSAEDDLRWVEENIGRIGADDDDDERRMVIEEVSKMA